MWAVLYLLTGGVFILRAGSTEWFHRSGRGMCLTNAQGSTKLSYTESYVQPVYQPYLMACEGHRICSSYRTTYKIAYREGFRKVPQALYACCPGWKKISSYTQTCSKEMCKLPCQHGGVCLGINKCGCPPGWCGKYCQTDVDECGGVSHGCSHNCVNTAGSYQCECRGGYAVAANGKSCKSMEKPLHNTATPTLRTAGRRRRKTTSEATAAAAKVQEETELRTSDDTKGEIKELKGRVETLEQKLQLLLAPFYNLLPQAEDDISTDPISLLSHSFQQLDRIDSLSEQISFLEERLETCSCKNEV